MSDLTPLSSDQERLWLRRYLFPRWGNESPAVVWLGPMKPAAVHAACSALVRRHPTLRTVYPTTDGVPAQRVRPATRFAVSLVDLSSLPAPARRAALSEVVEAEAARPFDLDTGPVIRVELVRLDTDEHVLISGVHHIAVDPWSIVLLGEDLMGLAGSAAAGTPARRAPVTTYVDYVAWLARRRTSPAAEADHRFWRQTLAGIAAVEVPLDHPRPRRLTTDMVVHAVDLPGEVSELLRESARGAGVTTFVALLTCFVALVRRWTGARRFAVMTVPSGRVRPEFTSIVGLFTGDVVVWCDASGDPTVGELLGRVRDAVLDTFDHPEPAFNQLAAQLDPERSLVPHPLRQLGVVLHNRRPPEVELTRADLPVESIMHGDATADIWLDVFDSGSGPMRMRLELAEPMFSVRTGQLTAERLTTLIRAAMAEPARPVSELPIIGPVEAGLLAGWTGRRAGGPPFDIAELLARRATRTPSAVAIVDGAREVTYAELLELLRHPPAGVARDLERGVAVRVPAGDRLEMITVVLAVLRAGGTVALDTAEETEAAGRHVAAVDSGGELGYDVLTASAEIVARTMRPTGGQLCVAQAPAVPLDLIAVLAAFVAGGCVDLTGAPRPGAVWLAEAGAPVAAAVDARAAGAEVWVRHRAGARPEWTALAPLVGPDGVRRLPLGRPLGVSAIRVVDQNGGPVPFGVVGELRIASTVSGEPEWATGEWVRFDRDGVLWPAPDDRYPEVGRESVDLAAVRHALVDHPAVTDAVVAVRGCPTTADVVVDRLVCWVTGAGAGEVEADLAARVAARTAIPASIVVVAAIPRDAAGIADLAALASPVVGEQPSGGRPAPATPTEATVAELYGEILDIAEVGRWDSFFVLGGTSMQVCRLGAYLTDRLGVEIPLYDLVLRPRVADVAAAVDAVRASAVAQPSSTRRTAATTGATAMSDKQRG